jgi:hypothetical protein
LKSLAPAPNPYFYLLLRCFMGNVLYFQMVNASIFLWFTVGFAVCECHTIRGVFGEMLVVGLKRHSYGGFVERGFTGREFLALWGIVQINACVWELGRLYFLHTVCAAGKPICSGLLYQVHDTNSISKTN